MPISVEIEPVPLAAPRAIQPSRAKSIQTFFEPLKSGKGGRLALVSSLVWLAALCAEQMFAHWAEWGNLSIDCGRELYTAAALAQGKMLYRDVWYSYTPASPYFNSYLFRLFGTRLEVLYWAGSLSALACAVMLFLVGRKFGSLLAGIAAGTVVLLQAFQPWLFSFPLPYSFAAVYGCVASCLFLCLAIQAAESANIMWVVVCGITAALAMLLKLEFGVACYAGLALLLLVRWFGERSFRRVAIDALATLPGVAICGAVFYWMISLRGAGFITQENFMSWPNSYFMKTYGAMWLENNGLTVNLAALSQAGLRTALLAAIGFGLYRLLCNTRSEMRWLHVVGVPAVIGLAYGSTFLPDPTASLFRWIFFPQDTVVYVAALALLAFWSFARRPEDTHLRAAAILLGFSALLGSRILLGMKPSHYSIYYDGPAVLCLLLLMRWAIALTGRSENFVWQAHALFCFALIVAVPLHARSLPLVRDRVPLVTEYGTIRLAPGQAENYRLAIAFMKEKAALHQPVLSIPEDTSLYFLSGVSCPTRLLSFTPGTVSPGPMTDAAIQDIERANVRYLLWSTRTFEEYGVPNFGVDYDRVLGNYFRSRYHFIRPLSAQGFWNAGIWERNVGKDLQ